MSSETDLIYGLLSEHCWSFPMILHVILLYAAFWVYAFFHWAPESKLPVHSLVLCVLVIACWNIFMVSYLKSSQADQVYLSFWHGHLLIIASLIRFKNFLILYITNDFPLKIKLFIISWHPGSYLVLIFSLDFYDSNNSLFKDLSVTSLIQMGIEV